MYYQEHADSNSYIQDLNRLPSSLVRKINANAYPCVFAKSLVKKKNIRACIIEKLDSDEGAQRAAAGLELFLKEKCSLRESDFLSFALIAQNDDLYGADEFELKLWSFLERLHKLDRRYHAWTSECSPDTSDENFCFSFGSQGFFVIGLFPGAKRKARRFDRPILIFNLHSQFSILKTTSAFERVKEMIRMRDLNYSHSVAPYASDHGKESEAIQYAGVMERPKALWKCPVTTFKYLKGRLNGTMA